MARVPLEGEFKPMITIARLMAVTVSLLSFVGCVNPYRANFNSTQDRYPNWLEGRLSKPSGNPRLMISDNIGEENWRLYERGYLMVGFSKFAGPDVDVDLALKEAKNVGADVVLVQKKFAKTLTETVTVTNFPPSETTTVRENTTVLGEKGPRQVDRRVDITTSKGPETFYVPKQVDYFEHSATFWRKFERPIFGAFVQDLSDEQKQRLQTNQGLSVRAIVTDSPAYTADLLKGDLVLKLDGKPVPSAQRFYEEIAKRAGQEIELSLLRGDKTLARRIKLNP